MSSELILVTFGSFLSEPFPKELRGKNKEIIALVIHVHIHREPPSYLFGTDRNTWNGTRYHSVSSFYGWPHTPRYAFYNLTQVKICTLLFDCHGVIVSSRSKISSLGTISLILVHTWGLAFDLRTLASKSGNNITNSSLSLWWQITLSKYFSLSLIYHNKAIFLLELFSPGCCLKYDRCVF